MIILNALKHGHFNQEALSKIYGNKFKFADAELVLDLLEIKKPPIVDNIICIASLFSSGKTYSMEQLQKIIQTAYAGFNGARCEAMYQQLRRSRNPNGAVCISECDHEQLIWIMEKDTLTEGKLLELKDTFLGFFKENKIDGRMFKEMKRKEFGAKIVEYCDGERKFNGPSLKLYKVLNAYEDLSESGIFDGYVPTKKEKEDNDENKNDENGDEEETKKDGDEGLKMKRIVIHTGNWGCGAFGGNVELHTMLQIIAAVAAGVDEMVYHAVDEKNLSNAFEGVEALKELLPKCKDKKGKIKRDLLMNELFNKGYKWGRPNGT